MGRLAKLTQPDETIPGSIWAFLASAIGSVVGGLTGSTPVIVQVRVSVGMVGWRCPWLIVMKLYHHAPVHAGGDGRGH